MEKEELLALIDAYLDGELSEVEKQKVEERMKQDVVFRQQVELQEQLRSAYADPRRQRLNAVLSDIMETEPIPEELEKTPKDNPAKPMMNWWLLVLLIGVVSLMIYFVLMWMGEEQVAEPVESEVQQEQLIDESPEEEPVELQETSEEEPKKEVQEEEENKSKPPRVIASADPADFAPNPAMEATVGGFVRSEEDLKVTLTSPTKNAKIKFSPLNEIEVDFKGVVEGMLKDQTLTLKILVFDNKNVDDPKEELSFSVNHEVDKETVLFEDLITMTSKPGLYYYLVETEEGDLLAAGKFFLVE